MPQETLTSRELQILTMIADGLTDSEIAVRLVVRRQTVSNLVSVILLKLHAPDSAEAVCHAFRTGARPYRSAGMNPPGVLLSTGCRAECTLLPLHTRLRNHLDRG